jgi:hypothetical protein
VTYDGTPDPPTSAGIYDVEVHLVNANYTAPGVSALLAIAPAAAHVHIDPTSLAQTYDGTPRTVTTSTTPSGLGGVTVTYDGSTSAPVLPGTYDVVAALDTSNYTPAEAVGTLVVSKAGSAIAFAAPKPLLIGRSTRLQATMTTLGGPAGGQSVQLMARPAGTSVWTVAGSAVTDVAGVASATVHPVTNTAYRWEFAGSDTTLASVSAIRTLVVLPTVTITLTKKSVHRGSPVIVWGTVSPGAAKQAVTLQILKGTRWVKLAAATLARQKMPDGHVRLGYLLTVTRSTKGAVQLRVVSARTSKLGAGTSPARTLTIT